MIVIAAILIGAFVGWRRAMALGSNVKDRAFYIAVFSLIFAVMGLFATVLVDRMT